jgi:ubiquinone biosynthesis O-methyltransferase
LRLDWINGIAPLSGKKVLDVGCGGGILTDAMARAGAQALGIDLATKSLKVAQLHALEAQTPNVQYREVAVEALAAEQPASFDVITCMEMLEHVPDPSSIVRIFLYAQPQRQVVFVRHRRCRVCVEHAAARYARICQVHSPKRAGA